MLDRDLARFANRRHPGWSAIQVAFRIAACAVNQAIAVGIRRPRIPRPPRIDGLYSRLPDLVRRIAVSDRAGIVDVAMASAPAAEARGAGRICRHAYDVTV